MRILAIDCGYKNLAFCLYDTELETKIIKWDVINLSEIDGRTNPDSTPEQIVSFFDSDKNSELLQCDTVIIEKQPPRNAKMRIIESILYTYFYIRGKISDVSRIAKVATFSPKHKLAGIIGIAGKSCYATRKKKAISKVAELLGESSLTEWQKYYCEYKKRDDLADCYLMVIAYIQQQNENITTNNDDKKKRILAKKPTDDLPFEKYTLGNIKFKIREFIENKDTDNEELQKYYEKLNVATFQEAIKLLNLTPLHI